MERKNYLAHATSGGKTFAKNKPSVYTGKGYRIDNPDSKGKAGDKYLYFKDKSEADRWLAGRSGKKTANPVQAINDANAARLANSPTAAKMATAMKAKGTPTLSISTPKDMGVRGPASTGKILFSKQQKSPHQEVDANPSPMTKDARERALAIGRTNALKANGNQNGNKPYVSDEYKQELAYNSGEKVPTTTRTTPSAKPGANGSYVSDEYKQALEYNSKTDNFFGQGAGSGSNVYTYDPKTGKTVVVPDTKQTSSAGKSWIENLGDTLNQAWNSVSRTAGEVFDSGKRAVGDFISNAGNAVNDAGKWIGDTATNVGNAVSNAVNDAGKWLGNTANNVGNAVGNAVNDIRNGMQTSAVNNANALRRMTGATGENQDPDSWFATTSTDTPPITGPYRKRTIESTLGGLDPKSSTTTRTEYIPDSVTGKAEMPKRGYTMEESTAEYNPEYLRGEPETGSMDNMFSTSNGRTAPTPGQTNTTMPRSPAQVRSAYEAASRAYEQAIQRGAPEDEIWELYNQARSLGAQYEQMI